MGFVVVDQVTAVLSGQILLPPTSFTVPAGHSAAITGPNGAGKTTLLRTLAGLLRPTAGHIRINGHHPDERNADFRRMVAATIGTPPFARSLTVREHLIVLGISWGAARPDAETAAADLLAELGIDVLANRFPHEMSSGQRQLFALSLGLARPCHLLILDEPEQALDADRQQLVVDALRRRIRRGVTVIAATHSPIMKDQLADQIVTIAPVPSDVDR